MTDSAARLVADASTIINLIATGSAGDIIAALPNRIAVVDVVPGRGQAAEVSSVERLEKVECFRTAHLTNEDPVGTVA